MPATGTGPVANEGGGGKGQTKWARFDAIPIGYKTVTRKTTGGRYGESPTYKVRVVKYGGGGWVKVGSPRYKQIVSYIGEHGHQAAIPKEYKVGKINPGLRVVGSPDSVDRNAWMKSYNQAIAAGLGQKAAQARANDQHGNQSGGNATGATSNTPGVGTGQNGRGRNPAAGPNPKTAAANAKTLGQGIGSTNVGQMTPMKDAVAQANQQFGAQINDTKLAQAEGQAQHAQNLNDIQQWYKQIGDVNAAAQTANQGAVTQEVNSDQGNMLAALRAIGGSANAGAGAVAAAGLNAQSLAQGLGQSQDAFSNLIQGALGGAQAGQMSAQSALDSQAARSLQQQLSDLQGQRGDAIVTNQDAIRAANNSLAQTRFGDRISKQQAVQAGVALAGNQRLQAQQLIGQHIANAQAASAAGLTPGSAPGHTAWAALKPADRYGAVTSAIKALGVAPNTPGGAQKVAVMLQSMGGWAPVHTMQFIKTFGLQ